MRAVVLFSRTNMPDTKKLDNDCRRMICVANANEMMDACIMRQIVDFEVCNAAAIKPYMNI